MPKFLFVRLSSIGDIVLTSPVVRCTKLQVPEADIHFITKAAFRNVVENNPYISKVLIWEEVEKDGFCGLRKEKYNAVIDLHNNLRSFRLKVNLFGIRSYSFPKLNFRKYLMVRFKINMLPDEHIVDRYFDAVKKLGVENDGSGLDYFIGQEGTKSFTNFAALNQLPNQFVALCIGAQHATKRMPNARLAELINLLDLPVILLGGSADREQANEIKALVGSNRVFDACGALSLDGSATALQLAAIVITHDTGLMHIAAALGKPIISIWGNTVPQFGMYPYRKNESQVSIMAEVKGLSCRPCSKIGFKSCPKGHFNCMIQQDLKWIAQQANKITSTI
ncbi:MAG: glycosyltransferase family 9 protein [Flavobacteriales bacterium]